MSHKIRIAPSLLSADFTRLADELASVEEAGADWIHVDVMDGHFVPNITLGPFIVEAVKRATDLPLDVHLMIERPERYIEDFVRAGANSVGVQVERIVVRLIITAVVKNDDQTIEGSISRASIVELDEFERVRALGVGIYLVNDDR